MKKFLLCVAAMLGMASMASAQTFADGDNVISASVGFGGNYGVPISVAYEKGVYDINEKSAIGVGGYLGYASYSEKFTYGKYSYSDIFIAATGSYHYTGVSKFDFYGGLRLGYDISSAKTKWNDDSYDSLYGGSYSASASGFVYSVVVGARYYFSESWAAQAEFGFGLALLNVGVAYKF